VYPQQINVGNTTAFTVSSLPDGTYYFVVQAYSSSGLASPASNQVVVTLGTAIITTCSTPDPFASLGGGTCYNGGWLPPGMVPPGSSPAPTAAPAPAPTVAPSSGTSCTTPDPFASLGGGVCYNGGWLPPGMLAPASSPAPTPAPAPAPAPAPVPASAPAPTVAPSSGTSCTTPDPFASLGGGACYNGSWLPPGMVPPGSNPAPAPAPPPTSTPAPTPAPTTTVSPSNGTSCSTPDPFAALGGGTCYNGGWLPPGMPIPGGGSAAPAPAPVPSPAPETGTPTAPAAEGCQTPDPFEALGGGTCFNGDWLPAGMEITVTGTLHAVSLEEGLWLIEAEDGTVYTPLTALIEESLADGAVVTFHALTLPSTPGVDGIFVVEISDIYVHQ
jgi:hypothetical protein